MTDTTQPQSKLKTYLVGCVFLFLLLGLAPSIFSVIFFPVAGFLGNYNVLTAEVEDLNQGQENRGMESILVENVGDDLALSQKAIKFRSIFAGEPYHPIYYLSDDPLMGDYSEVHYKETPLTDLVSKQEYSLSYFLNPTSSIRIHFPNSFRCFGNKHCVLHVGIVEGSDNYVALRNSRYTQYEEYTSFHTVIKQSEMMDTINFTKTTGGRCYLVFWFEGQNRMDKQHTLSINLSVMRRTYVVDDAQVYATDRGIASTPFLNAHKYWRYILIQDPPAELKNQRLSNKRSSMEFQSIPRLAIGIIFVTLSSSNIVILVVFFFIYMKQVKVYLKTLFKDVIGRLKKSREEPNAVMYDNLYDEPPQQPPYQPPTGPTEYAPVQPPVSAPSYDAVRQPSYDHMQRTGDVKPGPY